MSEIDSHLANFAKLNGKVPSWLQRLREAAIARFSALGFPRTNQEEWKYTNVAPLAKMPFHLPTPPERLDVIRERVGRASLAVSTQMVFLDGHYAPELSSLGELPGGARVASLAALWESEGGLLQRYLGRTVGYEHASFPALNTAFLQDGALVYVPCGAVVADPIHLLFVSSAAGDTTISHPRILVVAEESSQATVVESYIGFGDRAYCTNAVSEIFVGANAQLTHYKIQREAEGAFHIATAQAHQARDSHFRSHAVSVGGRLTRSDINTLLDGEGAECTFDGLYLASGSQHVDHHTCIDHQKPRCSSREVYKGVLDGHSTGVFNGKVYVRPDAQKSDASQVNKNLLLSPDAVIDTKPQLEIFADDVKCSHGATIGRLDEESVFYLRSRGIGESEARNLLIYAFANELVGRMRSEPVRVQLDRLLWSRFHDNPGSEVPL